MWRSRIFWRLFGTYGLLWLASVGILGAVIINRVEKLFLEQVEDRLRSRALLLREMVRGQPASAGPHLQQQAERLDAEIGARITLIQDDGTVLADSEADPRTHVLENHGHRPEVLAAREAEFGVARRRLSTTVHREMMYVAIRTDDAKGAVAFVRVALPLNDVHDQLAGLHEVVWSAVAGTALAGLVLTFWLARRLTAPLGELTRAAQRIAQGEYGQRVYAAGRDEFGTLARSFNHMSERLASQFAQLEDDRQQLRAILSGMVEGVVALDAEERILFANDRAAQLLEFSGQQAVGRKLWQVVRRRALQDVVRHALAGPEPAQQELSWNGPMSRSLTVHAARLSGSPPRGAVLVLHDTSELRRLERLRRDFVANVSHELKTPLSVIKACVETLMEGAVDDLEHRGAFLGNIAVQAERLHALILDLLSLGRIESGEELFELQCLPLEPLITACLDRHRARAEAKGQCLTVLAPEVPEASGAGQSASLPPAVLARQLAVWADEEAVSQILDNLVDNALKYTQPGGTIAIRWHVEDNQVILEVSDNGIGIPDSDLPRIFERFYRVDKARSRELGGTGLGLSIVKHLVQAMRGSVHARSRLGEGTTFVVQLPQAPAA